MSSSSRRSQASFRPVNSLLGARPTIGPIPADLFIPFGGISLVMSLISSQFLGLGMEWTVALILWGCTTWWILTGSRPYRFLSKFVPVPQRWCRGHVRYGSLQSLRSGRTTQAMGQAASQARSRRSRSARTSERSHRALRPPWRSRLMSRLRSSR